MKSVKKIGKQVLQKIFMKKKNEFPWITTFEFSDNISITRKGKELYSDLQSYFNNIYPEIAKSSPSISMNIYVWGMELGLEKVGGFHPLEKKSKTFLDELISDKIFSIRKIKENQYKPSHLIATISYADTGAWLVHHIVYELTSEQVEG